MAEIVIPGFRNSVGNDIFLGNTEMIELPNGNNSKGVRLLMISKYMIPKKEEVIDLIARTADGIDEKSSKKSDDDDSNLVYEIKQFPYDMIRDLATKNKEAVEHLKKHCPEDGGLTGKVFFEAAAAIVPENISKAARELYDEKGFEVYRKALERTGIGDWSIRIMLDNRAFPEKSKMDYLLSSGVKESEVLTIRGDYREYGKLAKRVEDFYEAFKNPGTIDLVKDSSHEYLEDWATTTVEGTAKCIQGNNPEGIDVGDVLKSAVEIHLHGRRKPREDYMN